MSGLWNGLSPFTRRLAVLVLLASSIGAYTKLRLQPLRAEMRVARADEADLRREVRRDRERVAQLQQQSEVALRWASYSQILEEQSTGRSLRDVLATCGTDEGPAVQVLDARFERMPAAEGRFDRMGVSIRVRGRYEEIIALLDELDRSFPPIELASASLRTNTTTAGANQREIVAELEGVLHEPR